MLYLVLGDKKPKGDVRIDIFSWDSNYVRSLVESHSLFGVSNDSIVLDNISESAESFEGLLSMVEGMHKSTREFYIWESDLDTEYVERLKEVGAKVVDERASIKKKDDFYKIFAVANAFAARSAKDAWVEYTKLRMSGVAPEQIVGIIWSKARTDLRQWGKSDLDRIRSRIIAIYHEARMGEAELDNTLERLLLTI